MQVVDFETEGIKGNPTVVPPRPVGCAFKKPGFKSVYITDMAKVRERLAVAIDNKEPLLFHNAKFDLSVMRKHLKLTIKDPLLVHDTLFLIFLHDPYADTFSLKPSAERILGWPPEERDTLKEWILAHVDCKPSEWGAHISKAPPELVAPYAKGDTDRTYALYEHLKDAVPLGAYNRERRLLPIIMESEIRGIKCDVVRLNRDMAAYEKALLRADDTCRSILKSPHCNLDSGEELADALEARNLHNGWVLTPTGRRSTARDALIQVINHPRLLQLLNYRGALSHCLSNFGRPWQRLSSTFNGRLHPEWNQVRQMREETRNNLKGTRTGRLSAVNPSFMNVPNEYPEALVTPKGFLDLPLMRVYVIPDNGYVWCKRDYSQQELRILAHYSEGRLYERYQADPRIDAHVETGALILEHAGRELPRKYVKITGFSIMYGSGVPHLAKMLNVPVEEGRAVRDAYFAALPEVQTLMNDCSRSGRMGDPITTWGGRKYLTEPPHVDKNGRRWTYEYKLLNYLIQGSAADCTKESIIRWAEDRGNGEFLVTVHDENDMQAPKETWKKDMRKLQTAMESIEFDVPMLSDGFFGQNWATLRKCP